MEGAIFHINTWLNLSHLWVSYLDESLVIGVLIIISELGGVRFPLPVVEIRGVRTSVLTQASPSEAGNEYAR